MKGHKKDEHNRKHKHYDDQLKRLNGMFLMDGMEHYPDPGCCGAFGKECSCGGNLHYQPVYGGFYYKCDKCGGDEGNAI